ncbi:MAG: 3-phosphoserine/phosphohydroxythreonine transaminase [Planctomycetaceae bacterium]|nr:3-phosphoserine/phosphohydroxythreonine transaminase [Planctomycetaceae bacterium]
MATVSDPSNTRVFNFSAGPATLPVSVLQRAQQEMLCLPGAGASVLEISHRSQKFVEILESTTDYLTKLLNIPKNYKVLYLQGGSRLQFSMIPMNFLRGSKKPADYVTTGSWGKKALAEAQKEGSVHVAWDGKADGYQRVPTENELELTPGSAYTYITSNETIEGVQFAAEPTTGDSPLICDASSDFLHRPLPIEKYGMIYACAQKNAGPAGVTIVIIRDDLLSCGADSLPGYLNYRLHAENDSMYNTPPTFSIYLVNLVAQWLLLEIGGLTAIHELNQKKAAMLYEAIDQSNGFYRGHANAESRSLMNVTFRLPSDEIQTQFIAEAALRNLVSLKGHRSVGGIRASIYNAMPLDGVIALRDFMRDFKTQTSS